MRTGLCGGGLRASASLGPRGNAQRRTHLDKHAGRIDALEASQVVEAMGRDKKIVAGTLHFVLPGPIGSTHMATDVTSVELQRALVRIGLRPERSRTE